MKKYIVLIFVIGILFLCGIIIDNYEFFLNLTTIEGIKSLKESLRDNKLGILILLLLQVIQSIIFIIPSEVIEVLSGLMYGSIIGFLICLIGNIISQIMIYYFVRIFNFRISDKYKINDIKVIFLVYLLPFMPKDLFNYLIPLTKINKYKYLIVSNIARIPSIISSVALVDLTIKNSYLGISIYFIIFIISLMILNMLKGFNKGIINIKK